MNKKHALILEFLKEFEGKSIFLESGSIDKYKRTLARIYSSEYLNLELVKEGLSSKFLVDKNELSDFDKAEKSAIEKEKGIWKKSEYYGCIKGSVDKKREIVTLESKCGKIEIAG